jgi:hypothetical protein
MTKAVLIALMLVTGYAVALPVLLYGLGDLKHIPGGIWRHAAQRPQVQWRSGMLSAYALGGWPAIVAVIVWRRSRERSDLLEEWAELSARKRRSQRRHAPARVPADPVIALVDYEASPSTGERRADA